jgi:hypothetical protein
MLTTTRPAQSAAIVAKALLAAGGHIRLFMTNLAPTSDTPLATFVAAEATFTGYVAKALAAFGSPYIDPLTGTYSEVAPSVSWVMTDTVAPNTIYGAFIVDATGLILMGFEKFATPIPLALAGQGLDYVALLTVSNN